MPPVLEHTNIRTILINAVESRLVDRLMVSVSDDATAGLIRAGKLQDDPTVAVINLLIHPGGEKNKDSLYTPDNAPSPYQIGGPYGDTYKRRFTIQFELFYTAEADRSHARDKSFTVFARARHALRTMSLVDLGPDSFGESAHEVCVCEEYLYEGGGEGDYNWRGEMCVEFATDTIFTNLN